MRKQDRIQHEHEHEKNQPQQEKKAAPGSREPGKQQTNPEYQGQAPHPAGKIPLPE